MLRYRREGRGTCFVRAVPVRQRTFSSAAGVERSSGRRARPSGRRRCGPPRALSSGMESPSLRSRGVHRPIPPPKCLHGHPARGLDTPGTHRRGIPQSRLARRHEPCPRMPGGGCGRPLPPSARHVAAGGSGPRNYRLLTRSNSRWDSAAASRARSPHERSATGAFPTGKCAGLAPRGGKRATPLSARCLWDVPRSADQ